MRRASTGPEMESVGVVVPAHQAESYIEETLDSLLRQTFGDWRCVVVNDGSSDSTGKVARGFVERDSRFALVEQRKRGVAASRNVGMAHCVRDCELVLFLDSDDVLLPSALETLHGALSKRPDAVGASGWAEYIDADGRPLHPGEHRDIQRARLEPHRGTVRLLDLKEDTTFASLCLEGRLWPPATVLVRSWAAVACGLFDEDMVTQEDWEFFLRLSRLGPLVFVDQQVAWYRRHGDNATNDAAAMALQAQAQLRHKTWRSGQTTEEQKEVLLAAWSGKLRWQILRYARQGKAALRAGRPDLVAAATWHVGTSALQLALGRPVVPPRWFFTVGAGAARYLRESGIDDEPRKVIG